VKSDTLNFRVRYEASLDENVDGTKAILNASAFQRRISARCG
jgi:hypothetical protein